MVLEAAVEWDDHYLLFMTNDVRLEEVLGIHLLDSTFDIRRRFGLSRRFTIWGDPKRGGSAAGMNSMVEGTGNKLPPEGQARTGLFVPIAIDRSGPFEPNELRKPGWWSAGQSWILEAAIVFVGWINRAKESLTGHRRWLRHPEARRCES